MTAGKRKPLQQTYDRPCWLDAAPDHPPIKHVITALSNSSATLISYDPDRIPDEFNLYFTPDRKVSRGCKVAWRSGNDLGLVFLNRGPQPRSKKGSSTIVEL